MDYILCIYIKCQFLCIDMKYKQQRSLLYNYQEIRLLISFLMHLLFRLLGPFRLYALPGVLLPVNFPHLQTDPLPVWRLLYRKLLCKAALGMYIMEPHERTSHRDVVVLCLHLRRWQSLLIDGAS